MPPFTRRPGAAVTAGYLETIRVLSPGLRPAATTILRPIVSVISESVSLMAMLGFPSIQRPEPVTQIVTTMTDLGRPSDTTSD